MSSGQTRDNNGSGLWKAFAAIVFLVQAIASAILCVRAFSLGMIPDKYLFGLVIAMWLLLMVTALLLFVGVRSPVSAAFVFKRLFAVLLAAFVCFTSMTGYKALSSVRTAVNEVAADKTSSGEAIVSTMNLYVAAKVDTRRALE